MQVWTGRPAGRADRPDHLSDLDLVADLDADVGQMAVTGRQAVAMIDFDHAAVAAGPPGRRHFSVRGRAHRVTHRGAEIQTGVHGEATEEQNSADSEGRREFNLDD